MMLKKWGILLLTIFVLTACQSKVYDQTQGNVADVKIGAADARKKQDASVKTKPALLVKKGPYVDISPISLDREPSWLSNRIVIRGDQLPFSYYSRTIATGAGKSILTKYQQGLDPTTNVTINFSGTVKGALDLLATRTGYVYTIKRTNIYWQAFVTKTFDIAFMPGGTDYLMGKTAGGGSSTSSASSSAGGSTVLDYSTTDSTTAEFSNLKATLSLWKDLDTTIKQLLSPEGKVVVSEASTSVTVRDRPTNVELIGQYISNLNRNLAKQVLIRIQIMEVNLSSNFNFGIDWGLVSTAFHNSPFTFNANYGTPVIVSKTLSGSTTLPQFGLNPAQFGLNKMIPNYQVLFDALSQQGKTSIVSEPRVVCLNNQVSVIRIVTTEGYAASIQNTTLSGSSNNDTVTSQITPGMIMTGLTLYVLPKIMKDEVFLQVSADLSTNNGFDTFGPAPTAGQATSQIQLPNVTSKHFNQRSMIRSGDTLVLSGFRQVSNRAGAMQFLTSQALGGKGAEELNKETIVLITPIILQGSGA